MAWKIAADSPRCRLSTGRPLITAPTRPSGMSSRHPGHAAAQAVGEDLVELHHHERVVGVALDQFAGEDPGPGTELDHHLPGLEVADGGDHGARQPTAAGHHRAGLAESDCALPKEGKGIADRGHSGSYADPGGTVKTCLRARWQHPGAGTR